jgi:ABC-type multidrug transport system fused ATPase/permease subunit
MDEQGLAPGTEEYKKARRRRQNRESASRLRAYKKEQLETIQDKLDKINEVNSKMELEIKKLKAENLELRQEAIINNKISFVYTKLAVLISVFAIFTVQQLMAYTGDSPSWTSTGILGLIVIFITFKN